MEQRKYAIRKGISKLIPPVFGESFSHFSDFSERVRALPQESYLPWEVAMDFFGEILDTSDNDEVKYMLKTYLIPYSFLATSIANEAGRNYRVANHFMVISFNLEKREMITKAMRQSKIKEITDFSSSPGKYVLLLAEEEPQLIPSTS